MPRETCNSAKGVRKVQTSAVMADNDELKLKSPARA